MGGVWAQAADQPDVTTSTAASAIKTATFDQPVTTKVSHPIVSEAFGSTEQVTTGQTGEMKFEPNGDPASEDSTGPLPRPSMAPQEEQPLPESDDSGSTESVAVAEDSSTSDPQEVSSENTSTTASNNQTTESVGSDGDESTSEALASSVPANSDDTTATESVNSEEKDSRSTDTGSISGIEASSAIQTSASLQRQPVGDLPISHPETAVTAKQPSSESDVEISVEALAPDSEPIVDVENQRVPVKIDRSSTMAQAQQLIKFEKQNQMAEAYLLASELVRQNPDMEFAYDAAIRTSIVLRLNEEVERFYREAIRRSTLPGKYFVQLAHFLHRTGQDPKLQKLLSDYEKNNTKDPDYLITLSRLRIIQGEYAMGREALTKAIDQKVLAFPLVMMLSKACMAIGEHDAARQALLSAADWDIGPWEKRTLLLELIKAEGTKPEELGAIFRSALINEASYERAHIIADFIIEKALETRLFHPLRSWLYQQIASQSASDMEIWLVAVMEKKIGDKAAALDLLTSGTRANIPVVAYERALTFVDENRTTEAIPIAEVLLAEQPGEIDLRLLLASLYLKLKLPVNSIQALAATDIDRLSSEQRIRYCETMMSAVVEAGDPTQIVNSWVDLCGIATFQDVQAIGDIIVQTQVSPEARHKLIELAEERVKHPGSEALYLLCARLAAQNGEHDEELEYYARYLEYDHLNTQMIRFVAELATQYALLPLKIETGKQQNSTGLSIRASHASRSDLGIELYRRLITLQPRITDHYSALVRIYISRGESAEARTVATSLADSHTTSSESQAMAASILDYNGMTAEALPYYRAALRLNPDDFNLWLKYAGALRSSRKYGDAEAVYKKILENGLYGKPFDQPQVLAALLKSASDTVRISDLVQYLDGLRARDIPGKEEFYISATKLLIQVKEYNMAEAFLLDFQKTYPDSPLGADSYLLLGQLYYTKKDFAKATELFQETAERFAGKEQAITAAFNVGELRRQSGEYREAIDLWTKLARGFPENDKALSGMYEAAVVAYADLKDHALTEELLKQYIELGPQDFKLVQKARDSLKRLAEARPNTELPKPAQ